MSEQQQEYGGIIINGIDCSGGGGSSVTPNPPAPATETLSSLDINGVVYGIEQETRENIFSIFDTFNLNDDCSSGQLVAGDHFTFGINDARNDWSGSTTIYNNNAYDLTDIDKLELVVEVTQQSDYAYLWLTFSNTKYTWGTSSWPGVYQNKTSALQISQSGNYEVDVSELTGNYYIYVGATSGKDSVTKGDCNNSHNGVISGTVTEFNILSKSSGGTEVIPNPSGSATDTLKKIKINNDIYEVADVEDVTEEEYSALPSTKNSDNIVYMVKCIEDIFDGDSTISLLGTNGITLEESDVDGKVGTLKAYEYSAGYEGFNIALKNLTVGNTYKLEFDFQFTNAQFIGTDYRCAYMMSSTQKTNYTDYTQWTENIPRDLLKHHHSVQFTASVTTMYIAFNLCGCSDNVNNYFTMNNIYVIDSEAQNKIIYNGSQYGSSAGGGSTVIANPSGAATATLNKVKIDNIIYQISTGGGSGGFASTPLYTGTQRETTINLSDDYTNYDYLVLQGCAPTEDGYLKSELISVDDIVQGNYIGVSDDITYLWYITTNPTTLTYKSASGGYYIKAIYGLKESSGGGKNYLTMIPCYAEFDPGWKNAYWNTHIGQMDAEYFLDFYIDQYQNDKAILGNSNGPSRLHLTMYSNKWYTSTGNGEVNFGNSTMITGRHTFRWNTVADSKILFDEQDTGLTCNGTEDGDINIYINNRGSNMACAKSRMYEFKITAKDGTVLHDFKPYALYAGSTLIWKGVMDVVGGMEADGWFNVKEIPDGGITLVGADIEPNPEDTPTETLSTIRIDDTVYNIAGGSGGEGTQIDVLFNKTPDNIHEPTITLSNSLFDYDEIAIDYVYVGNNIPYHIGHSYMTDDLNIGDNIGFESGSGNTWYSITNNTTLTLAQSQTAWCVVSIIGFKYGSGGSGGGSFYKMTTAEYDALPQADKTDPNKLYFIDDDSEQSTELDPTQWVNTYEASMRIAIINDKLTYTWDGASDIGANSVYTVAIPASINKIKFKITTGTCYSTSITSFLLGIGVRTTLSQNTIIVNGNVSDWLAFKDHNTNNDVWEDELDLSNVDVDTYLYLLGHGWNLTVDSIQLVTGGRVLDPNYSYHTALNGQIVVRVYHEGKSDEEIVWFFHNFKTNNDKGTGRQAFPTELAQYFTTGSANQSAKMYDTGTQTVRGWMILGDYLGGTINEYSSDYGTVSDWLVDAKVVMGDGTEQNTSYEDPYIYIEDEPDTCIYYQNIKYADNASGGVPTVHYTTDEQVIGTWVDGKPLYEKTFTGLSQATNGVDWVTVQGVDLPSVKDIINATAWATGGTGEQIRITLAEISVVNNNGIRVSVISSAWNRTINKMTVQYTKTTD